MLALVMSVLSGLPAVGGAPAPRDVRGVYLGGKMALLALVQAKKEGERELKIYGRAPGRLGATRSGHMVIRGPQELAKFTRGLGSNIDDVLAKVAKILKVTDIDWKRQMIVVISGGTQRTGGYSVEVTSARVKDDTLTINWKLKAPAPGQAVAQTVSHPALTILIDRFDSTVEYNPPQAKSTAE
jgi:hypothetical protein